MGVLDEDRRVASPYSGNLSNPIVWFEDHTDSPLRLPPTGVNNYVVAPESYETDQPIFGVKLMLLDSKDFAENPPDWYERKLPERLELV